MNERMGTGENTHTCTCLVGRLAGLAEAEGHEGQRGVRAVHQQKLAPAEVVGLCGVFKTTQHESMSVHVSHHVSTLQPSTHLRGHQGQAHVLPRKGAAVLGLELLLLGHGPLEDDHLPLVRLRLDLRL